MSIFKESFRNYVRKQFTIREGILSSGNDGYKNGRDTRKTIEHHDGTNVTIPEGSFYTYQQKTCVIRMASGADLTEEGARTISDSSERYFTYNQIKGSGLARRFVLQGGTLAIDRTVRSFSDKTEGEVKFPRRDKIIGATWEGGYRKQTRKRQEAYDYVLANRAGMSGVSRNRFGTAYGDPTLGSRAGYDDYGIVPMPGITKATIRTKTAYGSLREAKVEFVCHNQKQLEALELLYMRPGIPILLEWGWTTYINNKGERVTDYFPFTNTLGNWFIREFNLDEINDHIINEKIKTGGNYDAMNGMVKNFKYTARADGGYNCTTEIIAMGEILESLKGEEITLGKSTKDSMAVGLEIMELFSTAVDETTNSKGEDRYQATNALYFAWKTVTNLGEVIRTFASALINRRHIRKSKLLKAFYDCKTNPLKAKTGEPLMDLFNLNETDEDGNYLYSADENGKANGTKEGRLDYLKKLILTEDRWISGTKGDGFYTEQPYVRWDALVAFMNNFVLNQDAKGDAMVQMHTNKIIHPDTEESELSPLLYAKIPRFTLPYLDENGQTQQTEIYTDNVPWYDFLELSYNGEININDLVDMSINPGVCLLPGQVAEGSTPGKFFDTGGVGAVLLVTNPVVGLITGIASQKRRTLTADTGPDVGATWKRVIGHIYLNLRYLKKVYKNERYDDEGNPKEDFNFFDYIQKVWDSVNAATGHNHKFTLHADVERPNQVSIIDLQFQQEENITRDKLHVVKIQSNETICRDFQYDTTIPSSLSTTIAISVQNPDNINSIESATFAALSRNIKSRFHVPKAQEEVSQPDAQLIYDKGAEYDGLVEQCRDKIDTLFEHRVTMMKGKYQTTDDDGENMKSELVAELSRALKTIHGEIQTIGTMYPWTNKQADPPFYKGFFKKEDNIPKVASVIPLKFKAKFDGISGIVIGNVFLVDESRLPKIYQNANVGFIAMKESQEVTAGGDWTTQIEGQLIMLPGDPEDLGEPPVIVDPMESAKSGGGFNNFHEEKGVNYLDEDEQQKGVHHGTITEEQKIIDPGMELIQGNNERLYLKLGREATRQSSVRSKPEINNESVYDLGKDNMIGTFVNRKGMFIGNCTKVTRQDISDRFYFDPEVINNEGVVVGGYRTTKDDQLVDELENLYTPWYFIQFDYKNKNVYQNFNLGGGYDADGAFDEDGANHWYTWFTETWSPYQAGLFRSPFLIEEWHRDLYQSDGTYDGDYVMDWVKGQGWMRIDVLSANPTFGLKRSEVIDIIKTEGHGWGQEQQVKNPFAKIGLGKENTGLTYGENWTYEDTLAIANQYQGEFPLKIQGYEGVNNYGLTMHQDTAVDLIVGWNNNPANTPEPGQGNSYITIDDFQTPSN